MAFVFQPEALSAQDYTLADKHGIGAEKRLFAQADGGFKVGEIQMSNPGTGVQTLDARLDVLIPNTGIDLVAVVEDEWNSGVASQIVLNVTFDNDAPGTVTATLDAPAWAINQSYDLQHGLAFEFVPSVAGRKVKTINSIASITGGARWSKVSLWKLPQDQTKWQEIRFVENINFNWQTRAPVTIPDSFNASANVVQGRSSEGNFSVDTKYKACADGLMRFAGKACTFKVERYAGGRILVERQFFVNTTLSPELTYPDGNDHSMVRAGGFCERPMAFTAG